MSRDLDTLVVCGMCGRKIKLGEAYKVESGIGGPGAHLQQFIICDRHMTRVTIELDGCLYTEVEVDLNDMDDETSGEVEGAHVFESEIEDRDNPGKKIWLPVSGYEDILLGILRGQGYGEIEER